MKYQVGVIAGDGIGPEVVAEAQKVLNCVADKFGHEFEYEDILMGGCSIDATGEPLTDHAIEQALHSDAVLMGSIGGNTSTSPWYKLPPEKRPEAGLLKLRKSLNLFANLRPAYLYEELKEACPLRDDIIGTGFIVAELYDNSIVSDIDQCTIETAAGKNSIANCHFSHHFISSCLFLFLWSQHKNKYEYKQNCNPDNCSHHTHSCSG